MPTRVFVHVLQARSLPVMDRASGLCDAYVKPQLKGVAFEPAQTQTARKTLNPVWHEQLRCDVSDDCLLQDEPLQLRVFDYDAFSADDLIGTVYVHCNSLYEGIDEAMDGPDRSTAGIEGQREARQLHGWFPIYDSMRGLCGELQVTVYIQHIMDFNPVEDSSIGVQVLCASTVPEGYAIRDLLGLVDELLVEPDPEHNWQDNFRSSRSSNDARQLLLLTMDGKLRRQIGRKVTELGGNALLAYRTNFDLEEDFIIARGLGTAARIEPMLLVEEEQQPVVEKAAEVVNGGGGGGEDAQGAVQAVNATGAQANTVADAGAVAVGPESDNGKMNRLSGSTGTTSAQDKSAVGSDSPSLVAIQAVTHATSPKNTQALEAMSKGSLGNLLGVNMNNNMADDDVIPVVRELSALPQAQLRTLHRTNRDDLRANLRFVGDVQLLSMSSVPAGVLSSVGGMVAARSVKVVGLESKEERVAGDRDSWWSELREDVRAHARALGCTHVLGYSETTCICEGVCVLSGAGTACVLDLAAMAYIGPAHAPPAPKDLPMLSRCGVCHIPYSHRSPPFSMRLVLCEVCGRKYVPDLILASVELPSYVRIQGQGQFLEVHVCRSKGGYDRKKLDPEASAGRVSEIMPFLEFDMHKQILCKLKLRAHNSVWGLKMQLAINEDSVVCIATGTSVLLGALPLPQPLAIAKLEPVLPADAPDPLAPTVLLAELLRLSEANRQAAQRYREDFEKEGLESDDDSSSQSSKSSTDSESAQTSAYVLEIDHQQELEDLVGLLQDPLQPLALDVAACTTQRMPLGLTNLASIPSVENCQLLTSFKRIAVAGGGRVLAATLWQLMQEMLGAMAFRLRGVGPALLCGVTSHLELPDDQTIQLGLTAMALTTSISPQDYTGTPSQPLGRQRTDEPASPSPKTPPMTPHVELSSLGTFPMRVRTGGGVELTGLGYVPGRRVVKHMDRILVTVIRELRTTEEGNLSVWTSRLLLEGQALCRAQANSLGANCVLHYNVQHLKIYNLTHKTRVYSLLVIAGDAVKLADVRSRADRGEGFSLGHIDSEPRCAGLMREFSRVGARGQRERRKSLDNSDKLQTPQASDKGRAAPVSDKEEIPQVCVQGGILPPGENAEVTSVSDNVGNVPPVSEHGGTPP